MPEDYYLDRDQLQHLNSDLTTLIEHVFDVENVLTRQTCYGKLPGHSADRPLPYSEKASEFLRGGWRMVCLLSVGQQATLPDCMGRMPSSSACTGCGVIR